MTNRGVGGAEGRAAVIVVQRVRYRRWQIVAPAATTNEVRGFWRTRHAAVMAAERALRPGCACVVFPRNGGAVCLCFGCGSLSAHWNELYATWAALRHTRLLAREAV